MKYFLCMVAAAFIMSSTSAMAAGHPKSGKGKTHSSSYVPKAHKAKSAK